MNATYPPAWVKDVVLKDGTAVQLRPIVPNDAQALQKFHMEQSQKSTYLRYFTYKGKLTFKELIRFTWVDYQDRVAFVAVRAGNIIGTAQYDRLGKTKTAEVAFNIADHFQGKGLAPLLLEQLVDAARYNGIDNFMAELLPENEAMVKVFEASGFNFKQTVKDNLINIRFSIKPTNISARKRRERARTATVSSIRAFMEPNAIAIIGASPDRNSIGGRLGYQLAESNFDGPVYLVCDDELELFGAQTYETILNVPAQIDVALIAVQAQDVPNAVKECGKAGVRVVVIYSTGFGEWDTKDAKGQELQSKVMAKAKKYGVRVLGPSSLGFINNDPQHSVNASFATEMLDSNGVSVSAQSFAYGIAIYFKFVSRQMGFRNMISTGNSADIAMRDVITYWAEDEKCHLGMAYFETFENLEELGRNVEEFTKTKDLVIGTHALLKATNKKVLLPNQLMTEYLESAGAYVAHTVDGMIDIADILRKQKLPKAQGVALVTNFPGAPRMAEYATSDYELNITGYAEIPMVEGLENFTEKVATILKEKNVGAVVCAVIPSLGITEKKIIEALNSISRDDTLLLATTVEGLENYHDVSDKMNCFHQLRDALTALEAVLRKSKRKKTRTTTLALPPVYVSKAQEIIDRSKKEFEGKVADIAVKKITDIYHLDYLNATPFTRIDSALKLAKEIAYPVTVQPQNPDLQVHDNQSFVKANISDAATLKATIKELRAELKKVKDTKVEIYKTPRPGVSCAIEIHSHESLGSFLVFEMDEERHYKLLPMTRADFADLVSVKEIAHELPKDTQKLEEFIATLAAMKADLEDIESIKCPQVIVSKNKVEALKIEIDLKEKHD
ncbi:MAG: GNAT family N-acetyltransferase [Micrococcaceae bacterium]